MRALALPALVLVLTGCAPIGAGSVPAAVAEGPSAEQIRSAMYSVALLADTEGNVSIGVPRLVQRACAPMAQRNRFRCCYVDQHGARGTAIVQWRPSQDDPGGEWFWVAGERQCSMRY